MPVDAAAQLVYETLMSASKHRLYHRLQIAAHRLQKAADRAMLEAGEITTAQSAVLSVLSSQGALTQREVAAQLGLNESAMTSMVGRLLGMGMLQRSRDEDDPRAWRLEPSNVGLAALKQVEKPFRRINHKIETVLSADEIAQLANQLDRIRKAFDAD